MTLTLPQIVLYAGAMAVLFVTPGPVWLAVIARSLSGGFSAAMAVALGVAVGDVVWPLAAILGVTWIAAQYGEILILMRWVAVAMFLGMGLMLLRRAGHHIAADGRLTRPGRLAGFGAGIAVILGNPKAILFYMGVLPGFFDLGRLTWPDVAMICAVSVIVPLAGNALLALGVERARAALATPRALRRMNLTAGLLLIAVALAIALS